MHAATDSRRSLIGTVGLLFRNDTPPPCKLDVVHFSSVPGGCTTFCHRADGCDTHPPPRVSTAALHGTGKLYFGQTMTHFNQT